MTHASNPSWRIRRATPDDVEACRAIVRDLPEYFTDDVPDQVRRHLAVHSAWVISESDRVVGFVIVEQRPPLGAEILWMAVRAEHRNLGFGAALLDHVLHALAADGVALVEAKTLDASVNYEPYKATRAFWEHHGFAKVDVIDPLPGWQEGNPAAIYICALQSTR